MKDVYPRLYNISFDHNISVAEAVNKRWQGFSFRRNLNTEANELLTSLKQRCESVRMHGGTDRPMWMLTKNRQFSVKSLYSFLINRRVGYPHKFLWKTKVPSKIKMFLWLMNKKSILTKDNLLRKGWKGAKECVYCGKIETIDHLFFDCSAARLVWSLIKCAFDLRRCPTDLDDFLGRWLKSFKNPEKGMVLVGSAAIFWALWKCRNDIIFRSKKIYDPMIFVRLMCNWIVDWSILQKKSRRKE